MFHSIQAFKDAAEFFPIGRIVPQRILKGPRRVKHLVQFGMDVYVMPGPVGYVILCDWNQPLPRNQPWGHHLACIRITAAMPGKNRLYASPYFKGGNSQWFGNAGLTDEQWLAQLNAALTPA